MEFDGICPEPAAVDLGAFAILVVEARRRSPSAGRPREDLVVDVSAVSAAPLQTQYLPVLLGEADTITIVQVKGVGDEAGPPDVLSSPRWRTRAATVRVASH